MDYFFFFYISEKNLQFRKKEKYLLVEIFGSSRTSNRIHLLLNCIPQKYYIYVLNICICIPQKYVHSPERNWKNSVFIRVKNFANL